MKQSRCYCLSNYTSVTHFQPNCDFCIEVGEPTETTYNFTMHPYMDAAGMTSQIMGRPDEDRAEGEIRECLINPARHETIEELIATINHESLHAALFDLNISYDDIKVHNAITKITWIDEYI